MTTKKNKDKKNDKGDGDNIKDDEEEEYDDEEDEEEYDEDEEEYDEEDEEEYDEDEEEYDEDEEKYDDKENKKHKIPSGGYFNKFDEENKKHRAFLILKRVPKNNKKLIKKKVYKFYNKYNNNEKLYFDSLTTKGKNDIITLEEKLTSNKKIHDVPMRFKILELDINERTKQSIIFKLESINRMSSSSGEYHKINNWLNILNDIPFNKYFNIPIKNTDGNDKICMFLNNIRDRMNNKIYGHKEAKEQIIRVLAQLISFPKAYGYIIGIQGSAGIGKTKLIKEGICNALNYPNAFISLSGTDDSSFLKGHSYTYEGATYGKICESLIKTGIMNPLLLFDELDKVSNTYKGQEIINTLIHITDPVQNDKFNDRYFEEIDLDISRSMIIFTFNDISLINPILKDRMIVINVKGYNAQEKIVLAKDYLIPEILMQFNLKKGDIIFGDEVLIHIIENIEGEEGVRNLKRAINNTISWVNMMRYVSIDNVKINIPYKINIKFYDKYCGINTTTRKEIYHSLYM
jgi:ATP-dependent Lon protease